MSETVTTTMRAVKPDSGSKSEDFFWAYTEEPHRTRRMAIIKAHPEVRWREIELRTENNLLTGYQVLKLCGPEPLTKYLVASVVCIQLLCAYLLRETPVISFPFIATAYLVGATANQNLFLAIHEISHNLASRSPSFNRALAIFANLPIGIPYSASFRPYHLTHHKSLGVDGLDTDLPTSLEAFFLDSVAGKAFFATFQILFYALRPMFIYRVPFTVLHLINVLAQLIFDYVVAQAWGGNAVWYFVMSSFLAGSLHPCAGHFIAEHYVFERSKIEAEMREKQEKGGKGVTAAPMPETFSYYGALNLLTYNVGLHNEHHDFPAIPWSRLPALHEMAREFYADLPSHKSWVNVIWQFVWDKEVGPWCRVKRKEGGRKVGTGAASTNKGWKTEELGLNEGHEITGVL